jgi:type IV pilus assembly protein PilN
MIRINLLPHREERRKQRKKAFVTLMVVCACIGGAIVLAVALFNQNRIANQDQVNRYIKGQNSELDNQIKEIASIKQDIDALKARQQAVEDLQGDRNQPVYLLDELVQQVPEGVYIRVFKQDGQRVVMSGYAHSNERVSELLRNLSSSSPWLERPELVEIRATNQGSGKDVKRVFDFTLNVLIKRPRDKDKDKDKAGPPTGKAGASASSAASAAPKKP